MNLKNKCVDLYLEEVPYKTHGWNNEFTYYSNVATLNNNELNNNASDVNIYNWYDFKNHPIKGTMMHIAKKKQILRKQKSFHMDDLYLLTLLRFFFLECNSNQKCIIQGIEINNLRYHRIDIRNHRIDIRNGPIFYNITYTLLHNKIGKLFGENMLRYFLIYEFTKDEENKLLDEIYTKYSKILSNSNRISKYSEIQIKNQVKKFRNKIKKSYLNFFKTHEKYLPDGPPLNVQLYHILCNFHTNPVKYFSMDLYLLSKIFSEFDFSTNEKQKRGPQKCKKQTKLNKKYNLYTQSNNRMFTPDNNKPYSERKYFKNYTTYLSYIENIRNNNLHENVEDTLTPENIIIYTGRAHTNIYGEIIKHYFTDESLKLSMINSGKQFVNIKEAQININNISNVDELIDLFVDS